MGQEFYDLGVNMALAPVTGGPLGRAPREGRNWEGFAADPYATGIAAYEAVRGLLDAGVLSCAKHYIAYEQVRIRASAAGGGGDPSIRFNKWEHLGTCY